MAIDLRLAIATVTAAGLAATLGAGLAVRSTRSVTNGGEPSAYDCAQSDDALIGTAQLNGFVQVLDDRTTDDPFSRFVADRGHPPLLSSAFQAERLRGLVARDAFPDASPPTHPDVHSVPLPVVGQAVAMHRADPLEVWQTTYTFRSAAGAEALMSAFRVSDRPVDVTDPTGHHTLEASPEPVPLNTADDATAASRSYLPDDGAHERTIGYGFRFGRHVLVIDVRGGPQLRTATTARIAAAELRRFELAC